MNDDYLMDPTPEAPAQVIGEEQVVDGAAAGDETAAAPDELSREREMHAATEARYKSLQGQYDSFKRERSEFDKTRDETSQLRDAHAVMQAQLEDMRTLVTAQQQVAAVEEPVFDEGLKGFLGDQASGFEQALTRAAAKAAAGVRADADKKIAALQQQLAEVQKKSQSVPFDVLRSSDSVYDEAGFSEFLDTQKDPIFGMSIKAQMTQLHAQGGDVIPALKRARDAYMAKRAAPAEPQEQVVNPRLSSAGSSASKAAPGKVDVKSLRAEYDGYAKTNLLKDKPRRLAIARILAQNGSL
jgi:hypothetical protein